MAEGRYYTQILTPAHPAKIPVPAGLALPYQRHTRNALNLDQIGS
jgi:hypothetical protein